MALANGLVMDLGEGEKIVLQRHDIDIVVDGKLQEKLWSQLPAYDEFLIIEPDTLGPTSHATRVRFFYNDEGLYVGVDVDQPQQTLVSRLSGRDGRDINRDGIAITLDTSGEGRYGYWFGVNLGDSLMDGTLLPERKFSSDWDGAWVGASAVTASGWSVEMFIPWGTVSMPQVADVRRIGMYMSRKVAYLDQRWGWPALPSTIPKFISSLQSLEVAGVAPKQQYSIYPFTALSADRIDDDNDAKVGADFFWRPSTNVQLTATLNPDFGIVESDDVVINLSATETFFPEKRLFFLEGQEVFVASPRADIRGGGVGNKGSPTTLINTRRIGGQAITPTLGAGMSLSERELRRPAELAGAAKLTGQNGRFRYGVMAAFEDDPTFISEGTAEKIEGQGSDYGVARLLYEDQPGGAYKAVGILATTVKHRSRDAMVQGVDGHYLSADGKVTIDGQLFASQIDAIDEEIDDGIGGFVDFKYTFHKGLTQSVGIEYLDDSVDINDLGYLQRNDNLRIRSAHTRDSSNLSWARNNQLDIRGYVQKNRDGLFTGGGVTVANKTTFDNLSKITLKASFYPGSYDDLNSYGNGSYRIEERSVASLAWSSDSSRAVAYGFDLTYTGEHLGGEAYGGSAYVNWRPSDHLALKVKTGYKHRQGWLLHQELEHFTTFNAQQWTPTFSVDYFLSAKQQFRLSMQWVGIKAREQAFYSVPTKPGKLIETVKTGTDSDDFSLSQLSLQARYRWEIAPLSDIFVVYTRLADQSAALSDNDFSDLLSDSVDEPLADMVVVKIRYRLGS